MNLHWSNEHKSFIELSELDQYKLSLKIYHDLIRLHYKTVDLGSDGYEDFIIWRDEIDTCHVETNTIKQLLS